MVQTWHITFKEHTSQKNVISTAHSSAGGAVVLESLQEQKPAQNKHENKNEAQTA